MAFMSYAICLPKLGASHSKVNECEETQSNILVHYVMLYCHLPLAASR